MKLLLTEGGVIQGNTVLPVGTVVEVGPKRAQHLIKAGAAIRVEEDPKPIEITINANVDEIEVATAEPTNETPEKPKPKRRRRKASKGSS